MTDTTTEYRGTEGTHWYASPRTVEMGIAPYAGAPVEEVTGKNGKPVKANVTHAREYGLAPGATAILNLLNKPQLIDWAAKKAALGVVYRNGTPSLAERFIAGEMNEEAYLKAALEAKDAIVDVARDAGSVIHKYIEHGFEGRALEGDALVYYATTLGILTAAYGDNVAWVCEKPGWHPDGFGFRTDLLGYYPDGSVVVVDFKTRDFDPEDVDKANKGLAKGNKTFGRLTPRDSEPMQVAANLVGHAHNQLSAFSADKTFGGNLYISRQHPNVAWLYQYTHEQLADAWTCFRALHTIYKVQKQIEGR
jgi:hypothetical protein